MKLGILLSSWEAQNNVLSLSGILGWPSGLILSLSHDVARASNTPILQLPYIPDELLEFHQGGPGVALMDLDLDWEILPNPDE